MHVTKDGYVQEEKVISVAMSWKNFLWSFPLCRNPAAGLCSISTTLSAPRCNSNRTMSRFQGKQQIHQRHSSPPGRYLVLVEKAGYHAKEVPLDIPESGIVPEKVSLDYQKRSVRFVLGGRPQRKRAGAAHSFR